MRWQAALTILLLMLCSPIAAVWGQAADLGEAQRLSQQVVQLYQQGKYAEAAPLGERALAIREKALGPKHPHTARRCSSISGA